MGSPIKKIESPAYTFCRHMWRNNQQSQPGHSWQRINQAMHGTLMLAVTGGLRFDNSDFNTIMKDFRGGYWVGCNHEALYRAAVECSNRSACMSYESWQGRKPFNIDGKRVFVGYEFQWEGLKVTCTSIKPDHIIACAPKGWDKKFKHFDSTPARRIRITREMVKEAKKPKQVEEAKAA